MTRHRALPAGSAWRNRGRGEGLNPARVAFFGLLGVGNVGNEASLRAVADMLRSSPRPVELSSICADPEAVLRDHGIPGVHMRARGNRQEDRGAHASVVVRALAKLRSAARLLRVVGDVDAVIMPGMGALEDDQGGNPWGMTFDLATLSIAGWLRRRAVLYVSIGASPPQSRLVAVLAQVALRGTSYVSFRDGYSADVYPLPGRERLIYPDVAFTLPVVAAESTERDLLVLGVMDYYGPSDDYAVGADDHARYLAAIEGLVTHVVARGWRVRLLIGDEKDRDTVDELCARLPHLGHALTTAEAADHDEVMREVSRAAVAVVSRYHNLVAALATATPVISLSYAVKSDVLMQQAGQGDCCQPIDDIDIDRLLAQVEQLAGRDAATRRELVDSVGRLSAEASAQRTRLLKAVFDAAGERTRTARRAGTTTH